MPQQLGRLLQDLVDATKDLSSRWWGLRGGQQKIISVTSRGVRARHQVQWAKLQSKDGGSKACDRLFFPFSSTRRKHMMFSGAISMGHSLLG